MYYAYLQSLFCYNFVVSVRRKPIINLYADTQRRDKQAVEIMRERGCSFSEAWLVVLEQERAAQEASERAQMQLRL